MKKNLLKSIVILSLSLISTSAVFANDNVYVDQNAVNYERELKEGKLEILAQDEYKFYNPNLKVSGSYGVYEWQLSRFNNSNARIKAYAGSNVLIDKMIIDHYGYYSGSTPSVKNYRESPDGWRIGALSTEVEARKGFVFDSTYAYFTFRDDNCGNRSESLSINPL